MRVDNLFKVSKSPKSTFFFKALDQVSNLEECEEIHPYDPYRGNLKLVWARVNQCKHPVWIAVARIGRFCLPASEIQLWGSNNIKFINNVLDLFMNWATSVEWVIRHNERTFPVGVEHWWWNLGIRIHFKLTEFCNFKFVIRIHVGGQRIGHDAI